MTTVYRHFVKLQFNATAIVCSKTMEHCETKRKTQDTRRIQTRSAPLMVKAYQPTRGYLHITARCRVLRSQSRFTTDQKCLHKLLPLLRVLGYTCKYCRNTCTK